MATITLSVPDVPYKATIDTEVMAVDIREAFNGVTFTTLSGRKMYVSERDDYFEITYDETPPDIRKMGPEH